MKKDSFYLKIIYESLELIEQYVGNVSLTEFLQNQMLIDAVSKRFEETGENANKLSSSFKNKHKEVVWEDLVDQRNFMVHVYQKADFKRLYYDAKEVVPKVKQKITRLLREVEDDK